MLDPPEQGFTTTGKSSPRDLTEWSCAFLCRQAPAGVSMPDWRNTCLVKPLSIANRAAKGIRTRVNGFPAGQKLPGASRFPPSPPCRPRNVMSAQAAELNDIWTQETVRLVRAGSFHCRQIRFGCTDITRNLQSMPGKRKYVFKIFRRIFQSEENIQKETRHALFLSEFCIFLRQTPGRRPALCSIRLQVR